MQKVDVVLKAIVRAGLDPLDFTIYAQLYVKPVMITYQRNRKLGAIINTAPIMIDHNTSLEVYPEEGIIPVALQIKEKFAYLD